ncbi:unnamed protein product [Prorocentrum cordatum]|uniref:Uncharacterized protein n=1 Tax=Prorocentrum cordatum TaxID=2364126 RepID=A0ABN9PYD4_9DINO|nr:unnamed protein product [Polarella glacialis]
MAPKKQPKAAAKKKAAPEGEVVGESTGSNNVARVGKLAPLSKEELAVNAEIYATVNASLELIESNPVFSGIRDMAPLSLKVAGDDDANDDDPMNWGQIAPFDAETFTDTFKTTGRVTCGINFFAMDVTYSATPGIPIRKKAVSSLTEHYYDQPAFFMGSVTIGVAKDSDDVPSLMASHSLKPPSPEEKRFAFVEAIARDIRAGKDDFVLKRQCALSVSACSVDLSTDDALHWQAVQEREDFGTDFEAMRRSAVQRLYEIVNYKKRKEDLSKNTLTTLQLQEEYKKVKLGSYSEVISDTFIEMALKVHKTCFGIQSISKLLLMCGSEYGSRNPFDYLTKLDKISRRAKGDELSWVFHALHDAWKYGFMTDSGLSLRSIEGKGALAGKSVVDIAIFKKKLRDLFMETLADFPQWTEEVKTKFRVVCAGHLLCREFNGCPDERANITWKAGWPPSAVEYLAFIEDAIFGSATMSWQPAVAQCVMHRKGAGEFFELSSVDEHMTHIKEMAHLEVGTKPPKEKQPANEVEVKPDDETGDTTSLTNPEHIQLVSPGNLVIDVSAKSADEMQKLNLFKRKVAELVRSRVEFAPDMTKGCDLIQALKNTEAGRIKGYKNVENPAQSSYVAIVYDSKVSGECSHRPHLRQVYFRSEHCKRLLKVALNLKEPDAIADGDLYILPDGGKHGNEMALLSGLCDANQKALQKCKKVLCVMYSEASIRERLKICRNTSGALQVEWMFLITSSSLTLPDKPRIHFEGTSNGEFVGPVAWAPFDSSDTWCLPQAIKKTVITKTNVVLAGGSTYAPDSTTDEKKESEKEIAFIRSLKKESEALAAIRARIPYVGVAFNTAHRDQLLMHIDKTVLKMFQVEGDKLYQPAFAELLKDSPVEKAGADETNKKTSAGKRKRETAQNGQKEDPKQAAAGGQSGGGSDDAKKALLARIAPLSKGKADAAAGGSKGGKRQKKEANADEEMDEDGIDELDDDMGEA